MSFIVRTLTNYVFYVLYLYVLTLSSLQQNTHRTAHKQTAPFISHRALVFLAMSSVSAVIILLIICIYSIISVVQAFVVPSRYIKSVGITYNESNCNRHCEDDDRKRPLLFSSPLGDNRPPPRRTLKKVRDMFDDYNGIYNRNFLQVHNN